LGAVRWPTVGTGAITGLGFNWIYERAEPNFTILFWEKIAPFPPPQKKFTYKSKQQNGLRPWAGPAEDLDRPGLFPPHPQNQIGFPPTDR